MTKIDFHEIKNVKPIENLADLCRKLKIVFEEGQFEKNYEINSYEPGSPLYGYSGEDLSGWETTMTDPARHSSEDGFRYLVHAIHDSHSITRSMQNLEILKEQVRGQPINFQRIDLLETPDKISEKPVISASLIDKEHRATWAEGGYILKVPLDNILKTCREDCGTIFFGDEDVVKKLYKERDLKGIANPNTLLAYASPYSYNEIVLAGTGRTGKKVEITGVFVKVLPDGDFVDQDLGSKLIRIARQNKLPVVRIDEQIWHYKDSLRTEDINVHENGFGFCKGEKSYSFCPKEKRFIVYEYGGKKSHAMDPNERRNALADVKKLLASKASEQLEKMVQEAEVIPDDVLYQAVKSEIDYKMSKRREQGYYPEVNP